MPTSFIIFGAKYLVFAAPLLALVGFLLLSKEKRLAFLRFGLVSVPLSFLLDVAAGMIWYNPRPFVVTGFAPLVAHAADNGFPSDHTMLAAACAALLWPFNKRLSIVTWIAAVLVGASRVAASVHHPVDIVASLLIAAAVGFVVQRWIDPLVAKRFSPKG